jgi:hypothetical protein
MKFKLPGLLFILTASLVSAKAQDIVTNGGFQTGNFTGWTVQDAATGSYFSVIDLNAPAGNDVVQFGATANALDYISQTLPTIDGTSYAVSYFLSVTSANQTPANEFIVNIGGTLGGTPVGTTAGGSANYIVGGTTLADIVNARDSGFTDYTTDFTATSSDTNLVFGARNGPLFDYLDNVSVTVTANNRVIIPNNPVVPEPSEYALLVLAAAALLGWKRFGIRFSK